MIMTKKVIDTFNQVKANQRRGGVVPTEVVSLEPLIHDMRLVKSRDKLAE